MYAPRVPSGFAHLATKQPGEPSRGGMDAPKGAAFSRIQASLFNFIGETCGFHSKDMVSLCRDEEEAGPEFLRARGRLSGGQIKLLRYEILTAPEVIDDYLDSVGSALNTRDKSLVVGMRGCEEGLFIVVSHNRARGLSLVVSSGGQSFVVGGHGVTILELLEAEGYVEDDKVCLRMCLLSGGAAGGIVFDGRIDQRSPILNADAKAMVMECLESGWGEICMGPIGEDVWGAAILDFQVAGSALVAARGEAAKGLLCDRDVEDRIAGQDLRGEQLESFLSAQQQIVLSNHQVERRGVWYSSGGIDGVRRVPRNSV